MSDADGRFRRRCAAFDKTEGLNVLWF